MAVIVEDGTGVANADSWVTRAEFIAYALSRGVVIADEDASDVFLVNACEFINNLEPTLKGARVSRDQATAYPRTGLVIEGWSWESTEIPRQVINAQLALALEGNAGEDHYNPTTNLPVTSKRVEGAVTVTYANPTSVSKVSKTQKSSTIIKVLQKNAGLFGVRV